MSVILYHIYCKNCQFICKPTGAPFFPHPESICTGIKGKINWVTGDHEEVLCKDININGNCIFFKEKINVKI